MIVSLCLGSGYSKTFPQFRSCFESPAKTYFQITWVLDLTEEAVRDFGGHS